MTFISAVKICLVEKYARFSGRAARSEYWWFSLAVLLYGLVVIAAFFAANAISGGFSQASGLSSFGLLVLILGGIGFLLLIVPSVAVTVRRFHDYDLSGWWVLAACVLGAVPRIGWIASIAILVVASLKGAAEENRFGPDPLAHD